MTIIEINARENDSHNLQSRNGALKVWEDGYIAVPAHLEAAAWDCLGYCDLTIEDGVLTGITPTERPPEPEPEPSELEKLQEQVNGLEEGKADKTEVQAVWDSMAAAYSEGVQSA